MERRLNCRVFLSFFALLFSLIASASPLNTTYQARIVKPDGFPLEASSVNFKFTVLDESATCILYAETFSAISMTNSAGNISFALGSGLKTFPASATTFAQVFNNATPALACDTGGPATYSPQSNHDRKVVMQFNDGSGWQTLPAMAINAVPYAIYAGDSLRLGGVSATSYVRYSTIPTCTASQALQYNGAAFTCLTLASGGGSITSGDITSALGYTPADNSTVTATLSNLGTSTTAITTSVGSLSASYTALNSLLNSHTTSLTTLTSTYASLAASMAAIGGSSPWVTSGSAVKYTAGEVLIGNNLPADGLLDLGAATGGPVPYSARTLQQNTVTDLSAMLTLGQVSSLKSNPTVDSPSSFSMANLNYSTSADNNPHSMGMIVGSYNIAEHRGFGVLGGLIGITGVTAHSGSGTVATATAGQFQSINGGSGLVNNLIGVRVAPTFGPALTSFGLLVDDQSNPAASGTYNIYSSGVNSRNYFMGRVGVGLSAVSPTALLQISQGNALVAPFKLTSGTLLTTPSSGAIEYDGVNLYYTDGSNTRRTIATAGAAASGSLSNVTTIENAAGNITLSSNTAGSVIVSATTASTNSQTGALVVKGGIGVAGNLFSSGTITTTSNMKAASITATNGITAPYLRLTTSPTAIASATDYFQMDAYDSTSGSEPNFKIGFCEDTTSGGFGATCFNSREMATGVGSEYIFKGVIPSQNIHFINGNIGIGGIPGSPLDVKGSGSFQASISHASNGPNDGSAILQVRYRGTFASPTAVLNNDTIGGTYYRAYDGANIFTTNAAIETFAGENHTASNKGTVMRFETTQNGQNTRQEIMRIHSNGFVGIGNTSPNALLQVGPSGSQNANYNIYTAAYRSTAGQGQYVGNWASTDYWGIGPATNANDSTLRIGITSDRTGTWSSNQNLNLNIGGNLNISGTITSAENLLPASSTLLMNSCPAGWTNLGLAAAAGSNAVACNGAICSMCQTVSATTIPAGAQVLMESCPAGWSNLGKAAGPTSSGWVPAGLTLQFGICQAPAGNSQLPIGTRFPAPACPTGWLEVGITGTGPSGAGCPTSQCKVCEKPGLPSIRYVFGGNAASATQGGNEVMVEGGRAGTVGIGGAVNIRGGAATGEGSGGSVTITGGAASGTTGQVGGTISISGGNGATSGTGGLVFLSGGYSSFTGQYAPLAFNANGGSVGIGTSTPLAKLDIRTWNNIGGLIPTNISSFASGGIRITTDLPGTAQEAISFGTTPGTSGAGAAIAFRKASTETNIDFYTNSGNDLTDGAIKRVATISRLGYLGVGLGSSDPTTTLHALTEATTTVPVATFETSGTSGRPYVQFKAEHETLGYIGYGSTAQDNIVLMNYKPGYLFLGTSSTVGIMITSATNVAVGGGVATPLEKLHVNGDISLGTQNGDTRAVNLFQTAAGGGNAYGVYFDGITPAKYKTILRTNGNPVITAMQSGRVGIGVSDPTYFFDVAGSGNFTTTAGGIELSIGNTTMSSANKRLRIIQDSGANYSRISNNGDTITYLGFQMDTGYIGVGTVNPSYNLDVNGSARATGSVAAWSDIRTKRNIKVIPDSLNKILQIRGVTFDWRNDEFPEKKFKQTRDMGVIAQEIEKVFPEVVQTDKESYKSVSYSQLVAPLIEAVKELYYKLTGVERQVASMAENKADKTEIEALKAENAELKSRLERLEKLMLQNQKSK